MSLDQMDLRIIRSLNQNGRKPFKTIAEELDVSDATIRKRVKRMLDDGVIKKYYKSDLVILETNSKDDSIKHTRTEYNYVDKDVDYNDIKVVNHFDFSDYPHSSSDSLELIITKEIDNRTEFEIKHNSWNFTTSNYVGSIEKNSNDTTLFIEYSPSESDAEPFEISESFTINNQQINRTKVYDTF